MPVRIPHNGARPQDVVDGVLSRYLVQTTVSRIVAYRRYRENSVGYFKADELSRLHWEYLYGQAAALPEQNQEGIDSSRRIPHKTITNKTKAYQLALENIRTGLAATLEVSEHSIEIPTLMAFYAENLNYARIPSLYPAAHILKEVLPEDAITLYRKTFVGEELGDTNVYLFQSKKYRGGWRAQRVAQEGGIILLPRQCGDAALVAAYAMEKCSLTFLRQNWYMSCLTSADQSHRYWYPRIDWAFWVMYGSWSICEDCGRLFFNDQYFRQEVYDNQATSAAPDLLSLSRTRVPDDPIAYAPGKIGCSSRWWYLPRMYRPVSHCGRCTPQCSDALPDDPGQAFSSILRRRAEGCDESSVQTGSLYRIPRLGDRIAEKWAPECITWPR